MPEIDNFLLLEMSADIFEDAQQLVSESSFVGDIIDLLEESAGGGIFD